RWPAASMPTCWPGTGSARPRCWTRTRPWAGWPAGSLPATARPPTGTWPSGRACHCGPPGKGWPASPPNWPSGTTAWPASPDQPPGPPRPGAEPPGLPPARLLGSFDPVLHGWLSREPVLGRHQRKIILGGMFVPFALVRGHAVGTWTFTRGRVVLSPLEDLAAADQQALRAD